MLKKKNVLITVFLLSLSLCTLTFFSVKNGFELAFSTFIIIIVCLHFDSLKVG